MKKFKIILFYVLSFTWGIIMSLIGAIVFLVLMCMGYKPKKYKHLYYIEVGEHWGGIELGCFFLCDNSANEYILAHESGHGLQNCL